MAMVGGSSAALAAAPQINDPSDIKAIKALESDLAEQMDLGKVLKLFAPEAVVIDVSSPKVFVGHAELAQDFGPQLAKIQSMKAEFLDQDILSDGTLACAAQQVHLTMAMKDGKVEELSFRQLDALRKFKGTWLIQQQHMSVPADPKSLKAVMNGPLPVRGPIDWGANPLPGPRIGVAQAKADIRKWVEDIILVMPLEHLMGFYGPGDGEQVYNLHYPGTMRGRKEITDTWAPLFATLTSASLQMPYFTVDTDGLMAFQMSTQNLLLTLKDGTKQNLSLRQSDCLRHVDGKWHSFFQMLSFPVDPATGKSVTAVPFTASTRSP